MILADTSLWVEHLRRPDPHLSILLDQGQILSHAFVFGELMLGDTRQRREAAVQLAQLFQATPANDDEVYTFIRRHNLWESGIGYIDVHLLLSTALTPGAHLWSLDQRLMRAAQKLALAYIPS